MWSHVLVSFIKVIKLTQADRIAKIYERGSSKFHLIEIVIFHLIESFIFTWSNFLRLFTWSKLSIMRLIKRLKSCQLIETFINDLIKCQKRTYGFWQLIESSNNGILAFKKFRSSAKICKLFFGTWSKVFKWI